MHKSVSTLKSLPSVILVLFFNLLFVSANATIWTVDSLNNSGVGSLRTAISSAAGGDTIQFNPNLILLGSDSIVLSSEIVFSKSLYINGLYNLSDTLFISGGGTNRIFLITNTSTITLDSLMFINGYNNSILNSGGGGAVFVSTVDSVFINHCVFRNNKAKVGGALRTRSIKKLEIGFCEFSNNAVTSGSSTTGYGGAMSIHGSSSIGTEVKISNCIVRDNSAQKDSGGISCSYGRVIIDSTEVYGNTHRGIDLRGCENGLISNSSIHHNAGYGIEAANIYNSNDTIQIENSEIYDCGGGLLIGTPTTILTNLTVYGNTAVDGGGAYCMVKELWVDGCEFYNNHATNLGGGLFVVEAGFTSNYVINVSNSHFHHNSATWWGGGFSTQTFGSMVIMNMNNVVLDSNTANYGGGLFLDGWGPAYFNMDSCHVEGNQSIYKGGGIYVNDSFHFLNSTLKGNSSGTSGGGMFYDDGYNYPVNIENSTIESNVSQIDGGGIATFNSYGITTLNVKGSTFSENIAKRNGGAISMEGISGGANVKNDLFIDESSIVLNSADTLGGGINLNTSSNGADAICRMFMNNCTVAKNTSPIAGSGINVKSSSVSGFKNNYLVIQSNIIGLNHGSNNISSNSTPMLYSNGYNLFSDTGYVDADSNDLMGVDSAMLNFSSLSFNGGTTKTLMPQIPSTAIDAGNPLDTVSAQNVPVVGIRDAGAAEFCSATSSVYTHVGCTQFTWINGVTYFFSNYTDTYTLVNASGCDSIITLDLTLNSTYSTDSIVACDSYTWINGNTYNTSDSTARDTLVNAVGCDSIITLNITIIHTDSSITLSGDTISANLKGAKYQWYDCLMFTPMVDDTLDYFTPTLTGDYAVEINNQGCLDTSACVTVYKCDLTASYIYSSQGNGMYAFTDQSTGSYTAVHWAFGDGTTTTLSNPNHTFISNGTYVVAMNIYDSLVTGDSCVGFALDTINVTGVSNTVACQAGFVIIPDTLNGTIDVINTSQGSGLSYTWNFGDGNTSTSQNPTHTYSGNGPYNLCVNIDDGNGCTDTYCDSITSNGVLFKVGFTINVASPLNLSVDEVGAQNLVNVYPNPTSDVLNVEATNFQITKIHVLDYSGKLVKTVTSNFEMVDVASFATGVYYLELIGEEKTITIKFIKQ